jgi:hypothetical protein
MTTAALEGGLQVIGHQALYEFLVEVITDAM